MPLRRRLPYLVLALAVLAIAPDARAQGGLLAEEASVQPIDVPVENVEWPKVDHTDAGPVDGTAEWRVVEQTGNCCENYLTSTAGGRLIDFGGTYLNFSDDAGATWFRVDPGRPMMGGEGAVVTAPNGDILGVGWDVYSGDTLFSVKYEAASGTWRWRMMPLHTPFYDREWIGVVPGPFALPGAGTVPWVSFVRGGYPSKEAWLYSTDGLTYTNASSKFVESAVNQRVDSPLVPTLGPMADEIQGNTNMGLMPLGGGRALAAPEVPFGEWTYLNPETLTWSPYEFPGEPAAGVYQSDSTGLLHNVVRREGGYDYRVSRDGGASWQGTGVTLPAKHAIEEIDLRVSGADGVGVVAIHGHDSSDEQDQDLLYKFDTGTGRPVLLRRYDIGRGDVNGTSGVQETGNRFDFDTITLLPGGRVAMSFYDASTEGTPAVAVERSEPLPQTRPTTSAPPLGGPEAPPPAPTTDVTGPTGRPHKITLRVRRRSAKLVFSGSVRPPHPGHRVVIQRIRRGAKATRLTVTRADKRSRFRVALRLKPRRGDRFRALVDGDSAGHRRGVSALRKAL